MNNIYGGILIACAILITGAIKYKDTISAELLKVYGKIKAEKIIVDFFFKLFEENRYISLDDAILKFENAEENNLEDFAKSKNRKAEGYRDSYVDLYYKAKEKYYEKNKIRINGITFNHFFN